MNTESQWDFDVDSGHLAHASGLYAYVDINPRPGAPVRCVGPFSSFSARLTENQFYAHCVEAISVIESRLGSYTFWGAFSRTADGFSRGFEVLGETLGFIPNPSLRSCILLRECDEQLATKGLAREWRVTPGASGIEHRSGLTFEFQGGKSPGPIVKCLVKVSESPAPDSHLDQYNDLILAVYDRRVCAEPIPCGVRSVWRGGASGNRTGEFLIECGGYHLES